MFLTITIPLILTFIFIFFSYCVIKPQTLSIIKVFFNKGLDTNDFVVLLKKIEGAEEFIIRENSSEGNSYLFDDVFIFKPTKGTINRVSLSYSQNKIIEKIVEKELLGLDKSFYIDQIIKDLSNE